MKKTTLLAATALTLTCLGGQTLTTQAAVPSCGKLLSNSNGKQVVVYYGSGCDITNIFDRLGSCFPNLSLPNNCLPGVNAPETEVPEENAPEVETPEVNIPETEVPEENAPETNTPGNNSGNDSTEENVSGDEHAFIKQVVDLVNAERAKEGLSPLTIDTKVQDAAMLRAKKCEQLFSHTSPDGSSFATALKEQNVSYKSAGENIAWGQTSPEKVMNAWMNSSGHRANIMNPNFTTIGVGYYENAKGTDYWCQLFTR